MRARFLFATALGLGLGLLLAAPPAGAGEPAEPADPARGYRFLLDKPYLPADFDQQDLDSLWTVWPEPLRSAAERAAPEERRRMTFARYGLTPRPDDPALPLQYVAEENGQYTMNCFACHGGSVLGETTPGAPNSLYALQTLTEELLLVKTQADKPLARMERGLAFVPLGSTVGTTNAVMFGVVLMNYRDAELNVLSGRTPGPLTNHDMDPPPWWHFHLKRQIYIDGFAEKGVRGLMQFMLVRENGPEKFREWEADFRHVYAWLESLRPPAYPFEIDRELADRGRSVFEEHCARCHGTYGGPGEVDYPAHVVPLSEIGTDPVRLTALTPENRRAYGESWFAHYGGQHTVLEPEGYVAPPLTGVWASAPYFHNGSVPTLWHVLHPEERPQVWRRLSAAGYDRARAGLEIESLDAVPPGLDAAARRTYFDTAAFGKSAAGHLFPDALDAAQKQALLEYLKTL